MNHFLDVASQLALYVPVGVGFLQVDLLIWLLLAVIAGIVLIFILIAFILLPLSRRAAKKQELPPAPAPVPESVAPAAEPAPPAEEPVAAPPAPAETEAPTAPTAAAITVPPSGPRPDAIRWRFAGLTDVGLKRELNEDNLTVIEASADGLGPYGIYVVADGLGGHEAGEIASRITIDTITQHHNQSPPTTPPFNDWFKDAILAANDNVLAYQANHKEAEKMGSTLVMALVAGNTAHIANVGDSRAYQISGSEISQISVDHSLVERLVEIGQITREEARTHKQRNVVYSIIGEKRRLEIGHYDVALAPGDRLLLCSDGLSGMITDEHILLISQAQADPAQAVQAMIDAAKQAGGHDNITALVIQMN